MAILKLDEDSTIDLVWNKAFVVPKYDPARFRKDSSGAWIARFSYGDTESIFGWEIDHVYPISKGGSDDERNLRPINWRNNRSKGNDYPEYVSDVVAEGNNNIEKKINCTVSPELQKILKGLYPNA